jgi:hypothetical protein
MGPFFVVEKATQSVTSSSRVDADLFADFCNKICQERSLTGQAAEGGLVEHPPFAAHNNFVDRDH